MTSVSAKVSFPVMSGLFLFGFTYEKTITNASQYPERWGLVEYVEEGNNLSTINSPTLRRVFIQEK